MGIKQLASTCALLLCAAATELGAAWERNESSHSVSGFSPKPPRVAAGVMSVNFSSSAVAGEEGGSAIDCSSSASASSSVALPSATSGIGSTSTEQFPTPTEAPTASPTTAPSTTTPSTAEPVISVQSESNSTAGSSYQPIDSTSASSTDGEASIAQPGSDSSTFQSVASAECSETEVDNVYTLYSNCRSAFDLCVSASDYQIFPYQGENPTQAQIQGMAESDACVAVFVVVIQANFSACTIGGMPLVSAVETLLKISVDLEEGVEDSAPSADEFQELMAWRYEVDLAKAAGVPYDGSSELYAQYEANLDKTLENSTIRVNEDLSVDVQLTNGSYESFEDAIDMIVSDASAADLIPGYVVANSAATSSSSSQNTAGIIIESSVAVARRTPSLWSLVVVVAASFVLLEGRRG